MNQPSAAITLREPATELCSGADLSLTCKVSDTCPNQGPFVASELCHASDGVALHQFLPQSARRDHQRQRTNVQLSGWRSEYHRYLILNGRAMGSTRNLAGAFLVGALAVAGLAGPMRHLPPPT